MIGREYSFAEIVASVQSSFADSGPGSIVEYEAVRLMLIEEFEGIDASDVISRMLSRGFLGDFGTLNADDRAVLVVNQPLIDFSAQHTDRSFETKRFWDESHYLGGTLADYSDLRTAVLGALSHASNIYAGSLNIVKSLQEVDEVQLLKMNDDEYLYDHDLSQQLDFACKDLDLLQLIDLEIRSGEPIDSKYWATLTPFGEKYLNDRFVDEPVVVPASNRLVEKTDNYWNEPDHKGKLSPEFVVEIQRLIRQAIDDAPKASLSNSEQSQVVAQLEAAESLASAPVPKWGKVKEILAPLETIAVIGASISIILGYLATLVF